MRLRGVHELLAEAAAAPLPEGGGLTEQRTEELLAEIRACRDAPMMALRADALIYAAIP